MSQNLPLKLKFDRPKALIPHSYQTRLNTLLFVRAGFALSSGICRKLSAKPAPSRQELIID